MTRSHDDLLIRADGTRQWISWEVRPWCTANGEIGGIIIFSVDVTLRNQSKEVLEQRVIERTSELTQVNDRLQIALEQHKEKVIPSLGVEHRDFNEPFFETW